MNINYDLTNKPRIKLPYGRNVYLTGVSGLAPALDEIDQGKKMVRVPGQLLTMFDVIRNKRPRWNFVGEMRYNGQERIDRFYIFHAFDECLGWVEYNHSYSRYEYDCRALSRRRQRNAYTHSTKMEKAMSDILNNFSALSVGQRFQLMGTNGNAIANAAIYQSVISPYEAKKGRVMSRLGPYMLANWEAIKPLLVGASEEELSQAEVLLSNKDIYQQALADWTCLNSNDTILVYDQGDSMYVLDKRIPDSVPELLKREDVHVGVRTAVGMLKLVEKGKAIPGYGVRVSDSEYMLVPHSEAKEELS